MSKIDYTWHASTPPAPDVYKTRRNQSKYLTNRYWDGTTWWEIAWGKSRGGRPFTWPKGSRTRKPTSSWNPAPIQFYIRKISEHLQKDVQWGCPFRVYDEKEVLEYLVKSGRLQKDWKTMYQSEMRIEDHREIRV